MPWCPNCRNEFPDDAEKCWMCDAPLSQLSAAETLSAIQVPPVYATPRDIRRHALANIFCVFLFELSGCGVAAVICPVFATAGSREDVVMYLVGMTGLAVWGYLCGLFSMRDFSVSQILIGWGLAPLLLSLTPTESAYHCGTTLFLFSFFRFPWNTDTAGAYVLLVALPLCGMIGTLCGVRLRQLHFAVQLAMPVLTIFVAYAVWYVRPLFVP